MQVARLPARRVPVFCGCLLVPAVRIRCYATHAPTRVVNNDTSLFSLYSSVLLVTTFRRSRSACYKRCRCDYDYTTPHAFTQVYLCAKALPLKNKDCTFNIISADCPAFSVQRSTSTSKSPCGPGYSSFQASSFKSHTEIVDNNLGNAADAHRSRMRRITRA